ncbi:MAG: protein kinase [Polyangiaceae bacterium]|jgi:serine/threonine-protein kinase
MLVIDDSTSADVQSGERALRDHAVPEPGSIVGGAYRIIRPLGTGAMGAVLLAHDETIDRRVAIKFAQPDFRGPCCRERVLEEARAMARINHPHVLQIYGVGEHDKSPFIVMEFIEGATLAQWLRARRSPPELDVALRILDEVCSGVAAIHAQNTVHLDIKPSNILLDDQLRARVADLGLADLWRKDVPSQPEFVGTPAYMAPEIAFPNGSDSALRSRADVYSLACVSYELLTGHLPFDGSGSLELFVQDATRPVPRLSSLRADLPEELSRAVLRALAKDPRERTPSIEIFRRQLAAARRLRLEPERILVAEDNEDFREGVKLMLSVAFPDAEIECVADGRAALDAFDRKRPSVTLLDLQMPGIDGISLTRLLRERTASAAMPIIVLTGSGGSDAWRQLAGLGADRLLLKPVVANDVVALIRRRLVERSGAMLQEVA